jgi:hypothetical protein
MLDMALKTKLLATLAVAAIAILVLLASPVSAAPSAVTVTELVSRPGDYDRLQVVFEGECIGAVLMRGSYAWLSVNDGSSAIGVLVSADMARSVKSLGNWKQTGDRVRITGTMLVASEAHGGETFVEAEKLEVIKSGRAREHPITASRVVLALASLALASAAGLVAVRRYGWL